MSSPRNARRRQPAGGRRPSRQVAVWWLLWLALLAGAGSAARAQEVDVMVDPPILALGESLTVTFSMAGAGAALEPDFAPLTEQFEVLRTNVRDTLQIINGRTTQTKVWRLTLVPREEGTLTLPPIDFGGVSSPPRNITVTPARDARPGETDVFIELSLEPEGEVYVQSQVLLNVRLFLDTSVRVNNATLSEPESSDGDLVVEHIAEERSQRRIGERAYQVFEQRYALFPQRSGELELDPVVFSADMRSYFEQPAFRRVQSESITLQVKPAAPGAGGGPWLPAREVRLTQAFPQGSAGGVIQARVGEPVTRSVTLSAVGLTAAQLPPVEVPVPDGFKIYPDQPALEQRIVEGGVRGERVERLSMLPTEPGDYVLPAVEMTWWDVEADERRVARLEPIALRVLPAAGADDGAAPGALAGGEAGIAVDGGGRGGAGAPGGAGGAVTTVSNPGLWPWLALFLALGWAATGGLWWRSSYGMPAIPTGALRGDGGDRHRLGDAIRQVRQACESGDAARAREALLAWGQARWPREPVQDLMAVRRLGGEALAREIDRIDASRYAPQSRPWEGRALLGIVEELSGGDAARGAGSGGPGLEPLYR